MLIEAGSITSEQSRTDGVDFVWQRFEGAPVQASHIETAPLTNHEIPPSQLTIVNITNRHVGKIDEEGNIVFSPGGLVTGVKSAMKSFRANWKWFGWDGNYRTNGIHAYTSEEEGMQEVTATIPRPKSADTYYPTGELTDPSDPFEKATRGRDIEMFRVQLTEEQVVGHYENVSNILWWNVHHGKFDLMALPSHTDWQMHDEAMQEYVKRIKDATTEEDNFIVHDYQLWDLGQYIREERPNQNLSYFHHIAFQPADVLRERLPEEILKKLLDGLTSYDQVGFQNAEYRDNFIDTVLDFYEDAEIIEIDRHVVLRVNDRDITVGAFPISIDPHETKRQCDSPRVAREIQKNKEKAGERITLADLRRNDKIKDIAEALEGYELLLDQKPWLAPYIRYVCVIAESRETLPAHQENRRQFEAVIRRIHEKYGPDVLEYIGGKGTTYEETLGILATTDIAYIVTGQEGMNLVAKEAAAVGKPDMVLILGKDAGAAHQFNGYSILVDPKDRQELADAIFEALITAKSIREESKEVLEEIVDSYDAEYWITDFLQTSTATK